MKLHTSNIISTSLIVYRKNRIHREHGLPHWDLTITSHFTINLLLWYCVGKSIFFFYCYLHKSIKHGGLSVEHVWMNQYMKHNGLLSFYIIIYIYETSTKRRQRFRYFKSDGVVLNNTRRDNSMLLGQLRWHWIYFLMTLRCSQVIKRILVKTSIIVNCISVFVYSKLPNYLQTCVTKSQSLKMKHHLLLKTKRKCTPSFPYALIFLKFKAAFTFQFISSVECMIKQVEWLENKYENRRR